MEAIWKKKNVGAGNAGIGTRQSNLELLRILCMFMIVAHHFAFYGGFDYPANVITVNRLWIKLLAVGGKLGVDVFVLISGYFLVNKAEQRFSRIAKLWLRLVFYSVSIYFGRVLLGREQFGLRTIEASCLPVLFSCWWFASHYFVMLVLSPFLNVLFHALDRSSYQKMLALMGVMWCVVPTLTEKVYGANNLFWFIFLYALAGYIRLWKDDVKASARRCLLFAGVMIAAAILLSLGFEFLGLRINYFKRNASRFFSAYSLPIVLAALGLFMGFKKLEIPYNRCINGIASLTFGVYLIHDNRYIRRILWQRIFHNASFAESRLLIPYSTAVVTVVFAVCALVEWARARLLEKHYVKWLDRCDGIVERKSGAFLQFMSERLK